MKKNLSIFISVCAISLLSACGSPPNDDDLREAMLKHAEFGGPQAAEMLADLKVLACKKSEPQGYLCDIQGPMGMTNSVRLIKTDDGWSAVQPSQ
ncbi:MAG: hypothetical protein V4448_11995 [Pseudomonadota bacterium]